MRFTDFLAIEKFDVDKKNGFQHRKFREKPLKTFFNVISSSKISRYVNKAVNTAPHQENRAATSEKKCTYLDEAKSGTLLGALNLISHHSQECQWPGENSNTCENFHCFKIETQKGKNQRIRELQNNGF